MNPINPDTTKVGQSFFPLSLKPSSPTSFPVAYSDNIWDIVAENTAMISLTGHIGQYTQHDVNEMIGQHVAGIIGELGLGCLYMGIAVPATTPETGAKGFYFALTAGTYANFLTSGGTAITVSQGEIAALVRTGNAWTKQHIMIRPYIDPVSKHWIVDGQDSGIVAEGAEGKSAYEIWIDAGNQGTEQDFLNSLKATVGAFKPVDYDSNAPSVIGGTASTIGGVTASAATKNIIVLMPNAASDPTATRMYVTNETALQPVSVEPGEPADDATEPTLTYQFVYIGDVSVDLRFGSGQSLNNVHIVNDRTTGGVNDVLAAEQGKVLEQEISQLDLTVNGGIDSEVEHHGDNEFTLTTVSTRTEGNITSDSNYRSVKLQIPENTTKINAFCVANSVYYFGVAFYSSSSISTSTFILGNTRISGSENQQIEISVPSNATYVLVTVNASYISNAFVDFTKEIIVEGLTDNVLILQSDVQELDSNVESINENLNGQTITTEINHTSEEFNQHLVINRGSNGNYNTGMQDYKTIFLPIPENTIQIKAVCFANNKYYNGLTWYKGLTLTIGNWLSDYPMVSGISGDGLITINEIPENAVAIAVTALNSDSNCYVTFTTQTYQKGLNEQVDVLEEITYPLQGYFKSSNAVSSYLASMNQGDELSLITPNAFKNYSVGFSMSFDSVFDGRVSLETINTFTSGHIEIDGTNIYIYRGSDTLEKTIPHGLTISHFLSVSIIQTSIHLETVKIIVCSQSGMFINSDTDNYWYAGGSNPYKLKMVSGGCVNAKLTLSIHNCDVWLFGDSYLDYLVRNVTTVVSNELTNLYIDGYPGRTSSGGLSSLNKAINIANPKILVWALGMNDGDSASNVNANWLSAYNSVKYICKINGVELVLVTIPTTPSVNNNHKNNIIRNSGYRYVDVAMAVGADETGEWYEGLLSSDNVHPTSAGSKVIFGKYIADLPNMF